MINFIKRALMIIRQGWIWASILLILALILFAMISLFLCENWGYEKSLWWFFVTVTTVGYGDVYPTTIFGKLVAVIVMIGGIGTFAVVLSKLSEQIYNASIKKAKGLVKLKMKNHIAIFGYRKGKTEELTKELRLDESYENKDIVVISPDFECNPFRNNVSIVKGDLFSEDSLNRACIQDAESIIIYTDNDQDAILCTLAVHHKNSTARIIAYIRNETNKDHLLRICKDIFVIKSSEVPLIVQELQDPGTFSIFEELISNTVGQEIYRIKVRGSNKPYSYMNIVMTMYLKHKSTLIGYEEDGVRFLNPNIDSLLDTTKHVYYFYVISENRPETSKISWGDMLV